LELKINEVAKLTGVTVRTLHYYDEIGLLKPGDITEAGYRLYDNSALEILQQILFFRELDFSLTEIREIMTNPHYNKAEALTKHKELLLQKRNRLNDLIDLVDITLKGEKDMSFKQFDMTEIELNKKKYAAEAKERWGETAAYAESEEKIKSYNDSQWKILSGEYEAILSEFGKNRNIEPDSKEAQALVGKWQAYITANFYHCTKEILSCLGLMYVGDERFTQNIDQNGEGTAAFMAAAIEVYCAK
jgi:DNA-binding transcriptional MerR regulator